MFKISHEQPEDAAAIETLLEKCFGPDRFRKTAYRIREGLVPAENLSLVAKQGDDLLASIRYWPITVGGIYDGLLLGPIVVAPERQGEGIGVALIRQSLKDAQDAGHRFVVLVGDPDYYRRFGFVSAFDKGMTLPGPVEEHRFLAAELMDGALNSVSGMVAGNMSVAV